MGYQSFFARQRFSEEHSLIRRGHHFATSELSGASPLEDLSDSYTLRYCQGEPDEIDSVTSERIEALLPAMNGFAKWVGETFESNKN